MTGVGFRDETLEDHFSRAEDMLKKFIVKSKDGNHFQNTYKAIVACIQLGYRSEYEITHTMTAQKCTQLEVLNGLSTLHMLKVQQFSNWDFKLYRKLKVPLLLCDRPLFDTTIRLTGSKFVSMPLSKDLLLVGFPPTNRAQTVPTLELIDCSNGELSEFIDYQNKMTVLRARSFVVGAPGQLAAVLNELTPEAIALRKLNDKPAPV
jgi:hypothetical protein